MPTGTARLSYQLPEVGRDDRVVWPVLLYVGILHAFATIVTSAPALIADVTGTSFGHWGFEPDRPLDSRIEEIARVSTGLALAISCIVALRRPRLPSTPTLVRATALALAATVVTTYLNDIAFYVRRSTVTLPFGAEFLLRAACRIGSGIARTFVVASLPILLYLSFRMPPRLASRVVRAVAVTAFAACFAQVVSLLVAQVGNLGGRWPPGGIAGWLRLDHGPLIAAYTIGSATAVALWRRYPRVATVLLLLPFVVHTGWFFWMIWPPDRIPPMPRWDLAITAFCYGCMFVPYATAPAAAVVLFTVLRRRVSLLDGALDGVQSDRDVAEIAR